MIVTITGNDVTIEGKDLQSFLACIQQGITSNHQMLHSIVEVYSVVGFGDALHHHLLHLGEAEVDLRTNLRGDIGKLGNLDVVDL